MKDIIKKHKQIVKDVNEVLNSQKCHILYRTNKLRKHKVTDELNYCKRCIQMTNHRKEIHEYPKKKIIWTCLKCKNQRTEVHKA